MTTADCYEVKMADAFIGFAPIVVAGDRDEAAAKAATIYAELYGAEPTMELRRVRRLHAAAVHSSEKNFRWPNGFSGDRLARMRLARELAGVGDGR